jgi:hypothetical protein
VAGSASHVSDVRGIDALVHRRDALEREIVSMLPGSPWREQVAVLRCPRGRAAAGRAQTRSW